MSLARVWEFVGNHWILVSLFVAILLALVALELRRWLTAEKRIEPVEATQLINREDALVVDVREPGEYRKGHILNARNVPESGLEDELGKLSKYKDRPVIMYCGTGMNASRAASRLSREGFDRVYVLKGGLPAWQSAGMPVTKKK